MKSNLSYIKVFKIVMQKRILRVLSALCVAGFIISIILVSVSLAYNHKIDANDQTIEKAQDQLSKLQLLVAQSNQDVGKETIGNKDFASYDEVVPFIGLLESLFSIIDKDASILVKTPEEQIFMDHFADYEVNLKINNNKELFLKALDQLQSSRYITRIMSFNLNYKPETEGNSNTLKDVLFVLRLYFK